MSKWLAIAGLIVMAGVVAGQNPSPNAPKKGIAKQDPSKEEQHKPKTQPSTQPAPQPTTATVNKPDQDSSEDRQVQRWLMYFTGALVVVGALQFGGLILQARLLRQTRGDVKRQADWIETQAGHMSEQTQILKDSV